MGRVHQGNWIPVLYCIWFVLTCENQQLIFRNFVSWLSSSATVFFCLFVFCFFIFVLFVWPCYMACETSVPQLGINPGPL